MRRNTLAVLLCIVLALSLIGQALAKNKSYSAPPRGPVQIAVANPNVENRVHNAGKMWMNITNRGYFGNAGPQQTDRMEDPCPPGNWAPQCEFPGGSGQQYLFQAGLWIGALIEDSGFVTPRVSVGTDGWFNPSINEFFPGEGEDDGIIERSTRPGFSNCLGIPVFDSAAVSDQDFLCVMADTLVDNFWNNNDPVDGIHRPLGIKITQTSYSFSQAFAEDFILIDYEIENIASNFLKNLYVGLYVDSDCGPGTQTEHHTDDICGFVRYVDEEAADGGDPLRIPIDVAWIADNDGRPPTSSSGAFDNPHVTGTRVIRGPNPRLATSFNWWISNEDPNLDFGPTWRSHASPPSPLEWTRTLGTPVGDLHKYQVLSNCEFDYWQTSVDELTTIGVPDDTSRCDESVQPWDTEDPSEQQDDLADGFDTRYLLSWGPLGVFDHVDGSGNRIYRLNPGEKFKMTLGYVGGEYFHNPSNPQPSNTAIDTSLFNFEDLKNNAKWAKDVYDNRMYDTRQWDWGLDGIDGTSDEGEGDGIYDTGDGWYGEDVGTDGLYAVLPPGVDSVRVVYFNGANDSMFAGYYKGPDEDGTERNGRIDLVNNTLLNVHHIVTSEDDIMPNGLVYIGGREVPPVLGYWDMGFMSGNDLMDFGDGIPDFTGPPPPPIPAMMDCIPNTANSASHFGGVVRNGCYIGGLGYELTKDEVILRWSKRSSENPDYVDPFSRLQDFEGYRVHVSNINQETEFDLLGEWDKIDFAYYSSGDSLMTEPVDQTTYNAIIEAGERFKWINGVLGEILPVGRNTGFAGEYGSPDIVMNDSTYEFRVHANSLAPRYYAITAFDFGDPTSGLLPLTTRATTNAVLLAPAGDPKKAVMVVPNPYRAYQDYTSDYLGQAWENQNDGTADYYPQVDRRIEFTNLPERCLIRIFTVSGDLVQIIPHNELGDESSWASLNSEKWNLNSRNTQQVVSGIYLFSVEDMKDHSVETGKFVIIK